MYENSISVFCKASRLALEPAQSHIQVLQAIHLHLEPRLRMGGAIPPFPFMSSRHTEGQCFGGTCCIHRQVDQNMETPCPHETSLHFTRLQSITSQKIIVSVPTGRCWTLLPLPSVFLRIHHSQLYLVSC